MKAIKLIRYRIPVSVRFPAKHPQKGELTYFVEKILSGQCKGDDCIKFCSECQLNRHVTEHSPKLHTIRANYDLWAKRFEKINHGEAVLELYQWSGKPYASKAVTICQLGKDDGVGMQKIESFLWQYVFVEALGSGMVEIETIAKNDGLSLEDFAAWFKGYDLSQPLAIIHFTPFRY